MHGGYTSVGNTDACRRPVRGADNAKLDRTINEGESQSKDKAYSVLVDKLAVSMPLDAEETSCQQNSSDESVKSLSNKSNSGGKEKKPKRVIKVRRSSLTHVSSHSVDGMPLDFENDPKKLQEILNAWNEEREDSSVTQSSRRRSKSRDSRRSKSPSRRKDSDEKSSARRSSSRGRRRSSMSAVPAFEKVLLE